MNSWTISGTHFFDMKISVFDLVELVGNFCLNIKLDVVLGIWLYESILWSCD